MDKNETERDKEQSSSAGQPQALVAPGGEQAIPNEHDTEKSAGEAQGKQPATKDGKGPLVWFRRQRE